MKTYCILLVLSAMMLSGCATVQDKINLTEQKGTEKTFDYPYNKVFRSCEDVAIRTGWRIQESNIDEGSIYIIYSFLLNNFDAAIKVKKISDNKTLVKFLQFSSPFKRFQEKDSKSFFSGIDNLLKRD